MLTKLAILPAYEADLFGVKYVGPNHGRMLLASSAAALAGPSLLVALRSSAESKAIYGLVDQVLWCCGAVVLWCLVTWSTRNL